MTKREADKLMIERFSHEISKAQAAETDDEAIKHTDCAHKLYITLVNSEAFESGEENNELFGN